MLDGCYLSYSKDPKAPARGTLYLPGKCHCAEGGGERACEAS